MTMNLNYSMAFVWALAFVVAQTCFAAPFERWSVQVSNDMGRGQPLFLHCKSKDDDLGQKILGFGQQFSWKFRINLWQTTLFWCYMSNQHNHVSLEVFWPETTSRQWLYPRCDGHACFWSARDDGIYLKNVPENTYELHAKWEPGL